MNLYFVDDGGMLFMHKADARDYIVRVTENHIREMEDLFGAGSWVIANGLKMLEEFKADESCGYTSYAGYTEIRVPEYIECEFSEESFAFIVDCQWPEVFLSLEEAQDAVIDATYAEIDRMKEGQEREKAPALVREFSENPDPEGIPEFATIQKVVIVV